MTAAPWAEVADVATLTGVTVDEIVRNQAAQAVEMTTGLIEGVERADLRDRDLYWLKLAVCYQAAWIAAQPDYLERNDISTAGQDGESATYKPDGLVLAPLARRAIKRLSWRGTRSVRTLYRPRDLIVDEVVDDRYAWKPLSS